VRALGGVVDGIAAAIVAYAGDERHIQRVAARPIVSPRAAMLPSKRSRSNSIGVRPKTASPRRTQRRVLLQRPPATAAPPSVAARRGMHAAPFVARRADVPHARRRPRDGDVASHGVRRERKRLEADSRKEQEANGMKAQMIHQGADRTWALVFDKDDEVVSTLTAFAQEHRLTASHFTAIGAFSHVTLGYFDRERKAYTRIAVDEQVEVLSLIGDVARTDDGPKIHAHVVLGKADGTAHGGHLLDARVWPTLEVVLTESAGHLRRRVDPATGLPLIDLDATDPGAINGGRAREETASP
jgi:predicted DNA-binding protein with PD1-like motif